MHNAMTYDDHLKIYKNSIILFQENILEDIFCDLTPS